MPFDQTDDARPLQLLNIVDDYTREALAMDVERSIDADHVVATLFRIAAQRGYPTFVRLDHGPEFIAHALADWCRFNGAQTMFTGSGLTIADRVDRIAQRQRTTSTAKRPRACDVDKHLGH